MIHVRVEVGKNIKGVMETNNNTWNYSSFNISEDKIENRDLVHIFQQSIISGNDWVRELLNTIKYWRVPEEIIGKFTYKYLLQKEAFDWKMLANRIINESRDLIPAKEAHELLFNNIIPNGYTSNEFKQAIGFDKYSGHLNYFYGIIIEECLLYSVEEEIQKERYANGLTNYANFTSDAYKKIYGYSEKALINQFQILNYGETRDIREITELKEFTYWLFKLRIGTKDSSRIASDTAKGLKKFNDIHKTKIINKEFIIS